MLRSELNKPRLDVLNRAKNADALVSVPNALAVWRSG